MDKNIKKTIIIVLTVAILFTSGFILGALTAEFRKFTPVIEEITTVTTTVPSTTQTPTTAPPVITTTAPVTTETTTTTATTETTTATTTEAEKDEPCCIIRCLIKFLDFCKQIIEFIISVLSSL